MATPTITIDYDKRCTKCRKRGATQCGLCMKCASELVKCASELAARLIKQELRAERAERSDGKD